MARRALVSESPSTTISTGELEQYTQEWLLHCEYEQLSKTTIEVRQVFLKNLIWFLNHRQIEQCGTSELRQFFLYLRNGHEEEGGRWGNKQLTKPLRPVSIRDYHICLSRMYSWMVDEGIIDASPMDRIERPQAREEVKQPLTTDQTQALLRAARTSNNARRDEAIVMMLFDSGVRASELVSIKVGDVDLRNGSFEVTGKGNKKRMCYLGRQTLKVLSIYLRKAKLQPSAPLFPSRGGEALTRSGLLHLLQRLGKAAGVKVNVHQMRRTFATNILQNGSDLVAVRDMLGHQSISMTLKYLAISQSHIEAQHRQFSPGDNLRKKGA
jgi:integrase/recombinase XerD